MITRNSGPAENPEGTRALEPGRRAPRREALLFTYLQMAFLETMCPSPWDSKFFGSRGSTWKRLSNVKLGPK